MPLPNGSNRIGRSRLASTTRPSPIVPESFMASRITAKASNILIDLIALDDVGALDFFLGLSIHLFVADAIAGLLVELIERNALTAGGGRIKRHRTRNERQFQIALPIGARCHGTLLRN